MGAASLEAPTAATKKRHDRRVAAIVIARHGFGLPIVPGAQQVVASSSDSFKVHAFKESKLRSLLP